MVVLALNLNKVDRVKLQKIIPLLGVCVALTGCVAAALLPAVGVGGANSVGVGSADEQKLVDLTAKNFSVDPSQVKITNVKKDSNVLSGSAIHYDVTLLTNGKSRPLHCMVTSSFWVTSSPLCAKPGESLTGGSGDSCNALLKAAGKC